ncbi:hypothetical protein [Mesorhizobium sp. 1M-11]|uniref:hypothetical protein n=1 Tax=Mesorhizobium sp. 1M-11 TaxID=1529006 RepID=UPI000AE7291B|nr:hypothetical protein [Mesorhizobium sp. 1M-11]
MKKSTKLAFAFATLAGLVGTTAYAEQNKGGDMRDGTRWRLQKALKDSDGGITFDQFSEAMNPELKKSLPTMVARSPSNSLPQRLKRRVLSAGPSA